MASNVSEMTAWPETTDNVTTVTDTSPIVIPLQGFKGILNVANLALNLLGLAGLIGGRGMKKPMGVLILFLIVHNLFVGFLCMPVSIIAGCHGYWLFGDAACKIASYLQEYSMRAVIFSHVLICVERFVAIRWPYWYLSHVTHKTLSYICLASVCYVAMFQAVSLLAANSVMYWYQLETCFPSASERKVYRYLVIFNNVLNYSVMLYTSVQVERITHRHRKQIAAQNSIQSEDIGGPDAEILKSFQSVWLMTFAICQTAIPMAIVTRYVDKVPDAVITFTLWIMYLDTIFSTLIYQTRTEAFREDMKSMFNKLLARLFREDMAQQSSPIATITTHF